MTRNDFYRAASAAALVARTSGAAAAASSSPMDAMVMPNDLMRPTKTEHVAMLMYPDFTSQDLIAPQLIVAGLINVNVHLVWKNKQPVSCDSKIAMLPNTTLDGCPDDLTLLFVPGGLGTGAQMNDSDEIAFLQQKAKRACFSALPGFRQVRVAARNAAKRL